MSKKPQTKKSIEEIEEVENELYWDYFNDEKHELQI
jgi:hypothetical protein